MLKYVIFISLMMTGVPSFAQTAARYLKDPVELSTIDFNTFNATGFYSQAGNVVYKQSVSGMTDPAVFGVVYGVQTVGLADVAATFNGTNYSALSMVINKDGKLIGICAEGAPATSTEINKRVKAMEGKYGKASRVSPNKFVYMQGEKYVQVSLIPAMDDYNNPIPDSYLTYLYIVDKAYLDRIKEGLTDNEFKALGGM